MKANRKYFLIFLAPSLIGVFMFVGFPFLDVLLRSFQNVGTKKFVGFSNYEMIFRNKAFLLAVTNTILFTSVCIPLLVGIGLIIAVLLSKLKNITSLKAIYLFPLAIPTATMVMIWKMIFTPNGFVNGTLSSLGEVTGLWGNVYTNYLGSNAAFIILVLSYIWKNLGYTIVLWLAGILAIPNELFEASRCDGASEKQTFFHIVMPNLKGSLYTIVILSFLNSFKIYREAYLVAGAYPHKSIYLLQHLFNNWFVNVEFDKMAAAAVCTGIVLIGFNLLLQYIWDRN